MLQLRVLMLQLKIPLATTKKISHAHIPQLKNKTNKQTHKNSHTITKTPRASTKNWCNQIKKRQKLTHFLPHNFCGSGDGTWLTWALYCGVSHEAANEVSICQGWVSKAPGGKDPLPSSCGCWQDLVPHRLPD